VALIGFNFFVNPEWTHKQIANGAHQYHNSDKVQKKKQQ
jgi:hypothetical protein